MRIKNARHHELTKTAPAIRGILFILVGGRIPTQKDAIPPQSPSLNQGALKWKGNIFRGLADAAQGDGRL